MQQEAGTQTSNLIQIQEFEHRRKPKPTRIRRAWIEGSTLRQKGFPETWALREEFHTTLERTYWVDSKGREYVLMEKKYYDLNGDFRRDDVME